MTPDLLMHDSSEYDDVFSVIRSLSSGWERRPADREAKVRDLLAIWRQLEGQGEHRAIPRSMVAHLLADLQDDVQEEVRWDLTSLRALAPAWEQSRDPSQFDVATRFLASIFLSLADATRRIGDLDAAAEYLRRARLATRFLPDGDYATSVHAHVAREERLQNGPMP